MRCFLIGDFQKSKTGLLRELVDRQTAALRQAIEEVENEHQCLRTMLDLNERERRLIAYEIHDGLTQQLTGALYTLQAAVRLFDENPQESRRLLERSLQLLTEGLAESRRLIDGLRPPILEETGVVDAVNYLASKAHARGGPEIEVVSDPDLPRLIAPLENAIFRIIQEAINNACRHSRSSKVRVTLRRHEERLRLEIQDWGLGFDPAQVPRDRFGLEGIRQRARLFDGQATISSAPGRGTRIEVDLPLLRRTDEE
jgi:signal transduction histidine kinase